MGIEAGFSATGIVVQRADSGGCQGVAEVKKKSIAYLSSDVQVLKGKKKA